MAHPFRKVLCPLDFGPNTKLTIDAARQIAEQNGAKLVLLHVEPSGALQGPKERMARIAAENRAARSNSTNEPGALAPGTVATLVDTTNRQAPAHFHRVHVSCTRSTPHLLHDFHRLAGGASATG